MSSHHLPAGQNVPPAHGSPHGMPGHGGMPPPIDMAGGPPTGAPAHGHYGGGHHGMGGGPRGRRHHHAQQQYPPPMQQGHYMPQYPQHMNPQMYSGYGMPYGHQQYNPYAMPPQYYQNGGMHGAPYMQQGYPRSPPAMQPQFSPMTGVTIQQNFRHSQPSPALSTPYQPPPVPQHVPIPPQTPSSTHSSQMQPPPLTPQQSEAAAASSTSAPTAPISEPTASSPSSIVTKEPYRPPLPWYSCPEAEWTPRKTKVKTRRKLDLAESTAISLPSAQINAQVGPPTLLASTAYEPVAPRETSKETAEQPAPTSPTTPSQRTRPDTATSSTPTKTANSAASKAPEMPKPATEASLEKKPATPPTTDTAGAETKTDGAGAPAASATNADSSVEKPATSPPKAPPSSWANLFAKRAAARVSNGTSADGSANGDGHGTNGSSLFPKSNANSAAEAIRSFKVNGEGKVTFIEPRGLINTGNMCYMNSVLQVLMFCAPFYDFLNQVSKNAAHSFKSDTPLVDAMIMFMHEFKVLKSATSVEQLRRGLKAEDLEKFGEPFTPEFVYEAIRQLPRFASMRRGHQQDAEEFLGFLLQSLDDECTHVMGTSLSAVAANVDSEVSSVDGQVDASGDWLEVGRKQKSAVSRSTGSNASTPINKIFGGLLRSEFRVPGLKDSITTEPYQPLQLDIGSRDVRNVVDALRGLTRPERMQGDFNSPRGKDIFATKQVYIESLPPVLILHLKRFQFDAEANGTIKIWKHIDYPLELEIPREVLSRQKRQTLTEGPPKYKLISVVYHHGQNASGGHYTVDVRRQDGEDWVRFDDTVLRRVHSKDVAEAASETEKDPRKDNTIPVGGSANRFETMNDDENGDEDGWKQVTASSAGGNKRWSNVVNGAGTPTKSKQHKDSVKDNRVAYLLFYQRV